MQSDPVRRELRKSARQVRLMFGGIALTLAAMGLAARVGRHALGVADDDAMTIAAALLLAAMLYAGVLFFWDRRSGHRN